MNIDEIRARAEAAKAETNVFHRTKPLMPEDLELSLADDGYNPCLLRIMAHALFDIPALLDALEAKERELAEYRTAEEQGLLVRLPCKVGGDIYWINDEEKCVSVHKNGIRGVVIRNGEFAIEDTDGYIDVAGTKYCYLTREEAEQALEGGE